MAGPEDPTRRGTPVTGWSSVRLLKDTTAGRRRLAGLVALALLVLAAVAVGSWSRFDTVRTDMEAATRNLAIVRGAAINEITSCFQGFCFGDDTSRCVAALVEACSVHQGGVTHGRRHRRPAPTGRDFDPCPAVHREPAGPRRTDQVVRVIGQTGVLPVQRLELIVGRRPRRIEHAIAAGVGLDDEVGR